MLDRNQFFVKEHVGLFKLSDTYDIIDPKTQQKIGLAQERVPTHIQLLRLVIDKQKLPTRVDVITGADDHGHGGTVIISIIRGWTLFWRSQVMVEVEGGKQVGYFVSKWFSLGGGFWLHDNAGTKVAEVKGDWKGWNFKLLDIGGKEMGLITKKWAGFGRELFTSADNYMIDINPALASSTAIKALLIAACLSIDTIYKESEGTTVTDLLDP
jgi:uncharacterized protein YxjI